MDFLPRQARNDFYGMLVWGSCGQVIFSNLESVHVGATKIIFNLR